MDRRFPLPENPCPKSGGSEETQPRELGLTAATRKSLAARQAFPRQGVALWHASYGFKMYRFGRNPANPHDMRELMGDFGRSSFGPKSAILSDC